jgi:hypothetical protein
MVGDPRLGDGREDRKLVLPWSGPVVGAACMTLLVLVVLAVLIFPGALVRMDVGHRPAMTSAELATAKNDVRTTLLQGIGGLLLLFGAVVAWAQLDLTARQLRDTNRSMERQLELSQNGQIAERFTRAIDQLASKSADVRVGGIHGLEQIAGHSDRDAPAIYRILATYVRAHARLPSRPSEGQEPDGTSAGATSLRDRAPDVQEAITVIGRRPLPSDGPDALEPTVPAWERRTLLLDRTDLSGALLIGANLTYMHLTGACLRKAELTGAHLQSAVLYGVDLREALLDGANLTGALLDDGARLTDAWYDDQTTWPLGFNLADKGLRLRD